MGDSIPRSWHYDLRPKADADPLTHAGAPGWGALNLMKAASPPLVPSGQALNSQTWGVTSNERCHGMPPQQHSLAFHRQVLVQRSALSESTLTSLLLFQGRVSRPGTQPASTVTAGVRAAA